MKIWYNTKYEELHIPKAPTLKELLDTRKTNHATSILVSTTNEKDLFKGNISELSKELLNIPIFAWDKRDRIYITIKWTNQKIMIIRKDKKICEKREFQTMSIT